jgi:hypothetical protein
MRRDQFQELMKNEFESLLETNTRKGHDYAGDDDALANFKEQGAESGVTPEQIWSVHAGKHWRSIMTYVREGDVQSEPIEGRIHDLILYGFLLLGLVTEKREEALPVSTGRPFV